MRNSQNKKTLQIVLVALIAVLSLGIGYATISNINLIIDGNATANPNDNNFKVHFVETADTPNLEGNVTLTGSADIDKNDNTMATFNVGGLTKEGDYAIATYTIINNSNDVGAKLSLELTNSNADYFKVTETITDTELQAGETTTGTVKVEMIKTPLTNEVTTSITAKIKASALENASATGGSPASKASDDPVSFATDSWATIQKAVQDNNTSVYNVGDTKTVTINNTEYIVRLLNKTNDDLCINEEYSQTSCGFVVGFEDAVILSKWNTNGSSTSMWSKSSIYSYLQTTFYNSLPNDLKTTIINTDVKSFYIGSSDYIYDTNDKIYLLSKNDIQGCDISSNYCGYNSRQLDYYNGYYNGTSNLLKKNYNGTEIGWWLRGNTYWRYDIFYSHVSENGEVNPCSGAHCYTSDSNYGVAPAFRIG